MDRSTATAVAAITPEIPDVSGEADVAVTIGGGVGLVAGVVTSMARTTSASDDRAAA